MKANPKFAGQPKEFWANVRTISQAIGYTFRGQGTIRIPTLAEIERKFEKLSLSTEHIADKTGKPTAFGKILFEYFNYRAQILNDSVQGLLMDKKAAQKEFLKLQKKLKPTCPLPMNKQKGKKKNHAFLTGMVNMLLESNLKDAPCNYDPRILTTMTRDGMPLRTLSRRVDGAFPTPVNPIAIWEIKEYYYTTTFGSRVADGVYETLLDGMELEELESAAKHKVDHLLVIDDHFTWWTCGRSYLCRIVDMLHMGYVDEVIFGREVLTRLPVLAAEWKKKYDTLASNTKKK